jgi:S-formylglutathione hydrolase FrmB
MNLTETILSHEIAGNLLGNENERPLHVYLPPEYELFPEARFPTVYLLHGFSNRASFWQYGPALSFGALHPKMSSLMEELLMMGAINPMIVVMPDGWSALGCSQWVDSPTHGRFEGHLVREVVPHVDATYRTVRAAGGRGIMGISSGGFGAWHVGTNHPDVFGALALLSAGSGFDHTLKNFFYRYYDHIYPDEPSGPVQGDIFSWMCYGMAAAYSPRVEDAPYFSAFPVEFPSGRIVPEIWAEWLAFDPINTCETRVEQVRQLRGILLDVGRNDELGLHYGHRILSSRLMHMGVNHDIEEHGGTHTSHMFVSIRNALMWFSRHFPNSGTNLHT